MPADTFIHTCYPTQMAQRVSIFSSILYPYYLLWTLAFVLASSSLQSLREEIYRHVLPKTERDFWVAFFNLLHNKITSHIQMMCPFVFEILPFPANRIVLLLSCYTSVVGTYSPCAAKKWHVHSICPMASSIATSSASVELFVFNFCLLDPL